MNAIIKRGLLLIISCALFSFQPTQDELDLKSSNLSIENRIEIYMSRILEGKMHLINGDKIDLGRPLTIVNGDTLEVKEMHTRGQSTLKLKRKSISISLAHDCTLKHVGTEKEIKKFYAISLSMDKNYMRNRMAFGMLKELGLFDLFFTYGETRINGQSEGIYLLLERPQDWALKKKDSPFIIRRGYTQSIEKIKTRKNTESEKRKRYLSNYKTIYKSLKKYEGEPLYQALSENIDLDLYMKWLAFNYFVRNGDYTDEVYFYIDPSDDKFKIIPWDYDDIFASHPHEGTIGARSVVENKLLFSSEDLLDRQIAQDPYLYEKYLYQLREVMIHLTPQTIKRILEETYAELYPYFSEEEIIAMSAYDVYQNANLSNLQSELRSAYQSLVTARESLIDYLDSILK
jgi:spore coat protein H